MCERAHLCWCYKKVSGALASPGCRHGRRGSTSHRDCLCHLWGSLHRQAQYHQNLHRQAWCWGSLHRQAQCQRSQHNQQSGEARSLPVGESTIKPLRVIGGNHHWNEVTAGLWTHESTTLSVALLGTREFWVSIFFILKSYNKQS